MERWRLIDSALKRGSLNMAIDEAIAEAVQKKLAPPTLRFYGWNPPAVSIGYFQKIEEIDQERCLLKNYDIVRRPTGGRAILHDRDLTYSVIVRTDSPIISPKGSPTKDLLDIYKILHKGILIGLKRLGLNAQMVSGRDKNAVKSPACFFSPSIYELTVNGKKIVGSAQRRWQKVVLLQGSIMLDLDIEALYTILSYPNREILAEKGGEKITSINGELGKAVKIDKVKEAVIEGFKEALGVKLQPERLTDHETAMAFRLSVEKYASRDWTHKR